MSAKRKVPTTGPRYRPKTRPKGWVRVLTLPPTHAEPPAMAVWQHPSASPPQYWVGSATDPMDRPEQSANPDLPAAIAWAAHLTHYLRKGKAADPRATMATVRPVLWECQCTPAYSQASREVQLAVQIALTAANPTRAHFARLTDS